MLRKRGRQSARFVRDLVGAKEQRGGLKTAVLGQAQFFVLSEVDFGRGWTGQGSDVGRGWPGPGPRS